jgi:hypothetical protein
MSNTVKRVLVVTGQKPIAQVPQNSGGSSTLYEVYATDEHGVTIEEPLRTFAELEEGVPLEYEVTRYNHPRYGTSYTLTPPKRESHRRLRELEERVELLVRWAESMGFKAPEVEKWLRDERESEERQLRARAKQHERREEVEEMEPTPAPERPDLDERFGEQAPWDDSDLDLTPPAEEEPK